MTDSLSGPLVAVECSYCGMRHFLRKPAEVFKCACGHALATPEWCERCEAVATTKFTPRLPLGGKEQYLCPSCLAKARSRDKLGPSDVEKAAFERDMAIAQNEVAASLIQIEKSLRD